MNDRQAVRRSRSGGESAPDERDRPSGDDRPARGGRELTAGRAGLEGMKLIGELTGKAAEGVTGVEPTEDGWLVTVEVVEDRRIPSSTDVLATYEVELALDGELLSYRRLRRYSRGRGDAEDG
jgi:hypothetical protein